MVSTVSDATHRHLDPLTDLAGSGVVSPLAVVKTSLRHEYAGTEALVAQIASAGALSVDDIAALAADAGAGRKLDRKVLDGLSGPAISALAFLTIGRDTTALERTADLFALARRAGSTDHVDLDVQVNLAAGRLAAARRLLALPGLDPWVAWAARADLVNPFAEPSPAALDAWYAVLDEPFVARGIDPVRINDVATPFAGLTTVSRGAAAGTIEGPLVTIVVPVYAPGPDLLTSVGSLVAQTWRNLQIILVDDASPDEHREIFDQALALDDRIEHVRMPTNGGAYRARNAGIARATGELIGIQDADDWSHPERIARQMAVLDAEPGLVATLSKAVHLHSDLRITKVGTAPFGKYLPSLLFRRTQVLDRLGQFDEVRKAADGEFVERITAVFGPTAVRTLEEPLALYQLTDDSLSREDFRIGWHRHTRVSYHSAYRQWHRRIVVGEAEARLEPGAPRPFPAPPELEGIAGPGRFDVVLLTDTRAGSVVSAGLAAQVEALAAAGLSVGLSRAEPLRLSAVRRTYPSADVADVIAAGHASWAPLVADLTTELLVVRDPDLLTISRLPGTVNLKPRHVVVLADREPIPEGARRLSYDPAVVERTVRELFDVPTEWLPATPAIAEALRAAGGTGHVHEPRSTEVIEPARFSQRPVIGRPVIGVSDASLFAAERVRRQDLLDHLPHDDEHDVRLRQPSRRRVDPSWLAFAAEDVSNDELFDQCDFVLGLPPAVAGTTLVRPVLEAMSRGCVPVVDPVHRPVLGEAALYYGDRTATQIVDDCWRDPDAFHQRRQAARAFCLDLSSEAFASVITRLRSTDPAT